MQEFLSDNSNPRNDKEYRRQEGEKTTYARITIRKIKN